MSTVFEWQVARNGEGVSPTIGGAVVLPDFRGKGLAAATRVRVCGFPSLRNGRNKGMGREL